MNTIKGEQTIESDNSPNKRLKLYCATSFPLICS